MLDEWWRELGAPDPFVVVDAGAGRGTLARSVLSAGPACAAALRYVLVERSAALRAVHASGFPLEEPAFAFAPMLRGADGEGDEPVAVGGGGPIVVSLPDVPKVAFTGVVLANELLDNLAVRLLERTASGWAEVRVGLSTDEDALVEHVVPTEDDPGIEADPGARVPVAAAARAWLRATLDSLTRGRIVVFDYADTTASMAARPWRDWLRTYRSHERGGAPLTDLGAQDITCEVPVDQLTRVARPVVDERQADWLAAHGLEALVEEGRRIWAERAQIGDLAAVAARSRVGEAAALTDAAGLGSFRVLEWHV
jgi:SAM-dependent MidA family methyltransferase